MSESVSIQAETNEHDVAIAAAHAEAVQAVAEADAEARAAEAEAASEAAVAVAEATTEANQEQAAWHAELASVIQSQTALSGEMAAMREEHQAMLTRLDQLTPPPPAERPEPPPPNPESEPGEAVPPEEAGEAAAEEPRPPERKRAHRWI